MYRSFDRSIDHGLLSCRMKLVATLFYRNIEKVRNCDVYPALNFHHSLRRAIERGEEGRIRGELIACHAKRKAHTGRADERILVNSSLPQWSELYAPSCDGEIPPFFFSPPPLFASLPWAHTVSRNLSEIGVSRPSTRRSNTSPSASNNRPSPSSTCSSTITAFTIETAPFSRSLSLVLSYTERFSLLPISSLESSKAPSFLYTYIYMFFYYDREDEINNGRIFSFRQVLTWWHFFLTVLKGEKLYELVLRGEIDNRC